MDEVILIGIDAGTSMSKSAAFSLAGASTTTVAIAAGMMAREVRRWLHRSRRLEINA